MKRVALVVDRGMDDRLERGELVADRRAPRAASASRSTAPSRVVPGKRASIALDQRAARPLQRGGPSASASNTGTPASANIAATVDLPMPIDPVSASVIMA